MPFELGLFLGAKNYGSGKQKKKSCLIMDVEKHRYRKFCSDIAGQDIQAHSQSTAKAITIVRNWLSHLTEFILPGGKKITERYDLFSRELPKLCSEVKIDVDELTYNDFTTLVAQWLRFNPW